jgi:hypothetical protein
MGEWKHSQGDPQMKRAFSSPLAASTLCMVVFVLLVVWYRDCTAPRREAQEIWRGHERVISDVAMGKRVNLDEFESAVRFFEGLTKINVPSNHSTFIDTMPAKDTSAALEPLRRWYAKNQDRLYWDEEQHEVRLAKE